MQRRITALVLIFIIMLLPSEYLFAEDSLHTLLSALCGYRNYNPFPNNRCISDIFAGFWQKNGAVLVLGLPTAQERDEVAFDGKHYLAQWYERQRLEYHPENTGSNYEVELGLLGSELLKSNGRDPRSFPLASPSSNHYFPETKHAITDAAFWDYWSSNGLDLGDAGISMSESIALFGFPISEAHIETNKSGATVFTQWFQRARFEHRSGSTTVELGLLGNELTPSRTLIEVNRNRKGADALQSDLALQQTAENHAEYLSQNYSDPDVRAHPAVEQPGKPGFTGSDVGTRALNAGYTGNVVELVSFRGDPSEAVNEWLNDDAARQILLNPDYRFVGIGYVPARGNAPPVIVLDLGPVAGNAFGADGVLSVKGDPKLPATVAAANNVGWAREEFAWADVEPAKNNWQWSTFDPRVQALNDANISILGIIDYSVGWATPNGDDKDDAISYYMPDLDQYKTFVTTLAQRYKGKVAAWEIWNEPNSPSYFNSPQPAAEYTKLLITASAAIRSVDPQALLLTGGVSGNALSFLDGVLGDPTARRSFDALALHVSSEPCPTPDHCEGPDLKIRGSPVVHQLAAVELTQYRALMERHQIAKPIWVTEMGWRSSSWQLDEQTQADYLAQGFASLLGSGIAKKVFWFRFKDDSAGSDHSSGLIKWDDQNRDLTARRPAFAAYATAASILLGTQAQPAAPPEGSTVLNDFEQPASWGVRPETGATGALSISSDTAHSNSQSAKLTYKFSLTSTSIYADPPQPLEIPATTQRLGAWIRGDGSGFDFNVWLQDADGEKFRLRLASADAASAGWRYYEARLHGYFYDYDRGPSVANLPPGHAGVINYPVKLVSVQLHNVFDLQLGQGAIYIDDITTSPGPDVSRVTMTGQDGRAITVVWADEPYDNSTDRSVAVPAGSTVFDRDNQPIQVAEGHITVTSSPVYIIAP